MTKIVTARIHRAWFKVRLAPAHPLYFELQHGLLALFVIASSPENAQENAAAIVRLLPYEMIGVAGPVDVDPTDLDSVIDQVEALGFAMKLIASPTGSEVGDFEDWDWD